jgi:hypothetical protein
MRKLAKISVLGFLTLGCCKIQEIAREAHTGKTKLPKYLQ